MLYLATAWETHDRLGDPAVLYCGGDAAKALDAAMKSTANFLRVETAVVHFSFPIAVPANRPAAPTLLSEAGKSTPTTIAAGAETPAAGTAPAEPAAASGGEAEGPQLGDLDDGAGKKRRK